jgi:hypothetical protein
MRKDLGVNDFTFVLHWLAKESNVCECAHLYECLRTGLHRRVDEIGADASSCTGMQDDGDVLKFGGERCFLLRYTVC